ncbi:MAG: EAL domain-containing protein [Leptolyngbya sp. SIO1D8]|nr:EAL domain-containing protein [Leptolyngbya sp. SIO1D8]
MKTIKRTLRFPSLQYSFLSSLLATIFVVVLGQLGMMQFLEIEAYDNLTKLKSQGTPDSRLLIVEVTELDIQAQKKWPLSDAVISDLLEKLQQHQPKVIGLDIYRDIPQPPGTNKLLKQLQSANVIVIQHIGCNGFDYIPPPRDVAEDQIGFSDLVVDSDGVIRRNLMFATLDDQEFHSFSLLLGLKYLDLDINAIEVGHNYLKIENSMFRTLQHDSGGYQNIDAAGYQTMLQYQAGDGDFSKVTLTEVLNGQLRPEMVKDKIVLVGMTAPSTKDMLLTPFSSKLGNFHLMPGVVIHGHMTSQIISRILDDQKGIWYLPQPIEILWIWMCSVAGGFLPWRFKSSQAIGISFAFGLSVISGSIIVIFFQSGWFPLVASSSSFLLANIISIVNRNLYDERYDELTRLSKPKLFEKTIKKELLKSLEKSEIQYLAVVYLDIDKFRLLNESLGHSCGDSILIELAERLNDAIPDRGKVARIGGDEFAILLTDLDDLSATKSAINYLREKISHAFSCGEDEIYIETQFGVALCENKQIISIQNLLQNAHTAMYQAKNKRLKQYEIFSDTMQLLDTDRFWLESHLRKAVKDNKIFIEYQPLLSLETQKIIGFEALARWEDPERGRISPVNFIPIAEETGLIIPLGERIMLDTCQQLHNWQRSIPAYSSLLMSVNLSIYQLEQEGFVQKIDDILKRTGILGSNLKLEITESAAMSNIEIVIQRLLSLKDLGLKIGIDDFGTGYSSLSYLHRLPADTLKIDKSFIGNIENASENIEIVKTVISLGNNLGMELVAEGVETEEQLSLLQSLDCHYGQGYFFSRPLSAKAATDLLKMTL